MLHDLGAQLGRLLIRQLKIRKRLNELFPTRHFIGLRVTLRQREEVTTTWPGNALKKGPGVTGISAITGVI